MVGIRFTYNVRIVSKHFLYDVLKDISVDRYVWKLDDDDIYPLPVIDNSCLFNTNVVRGCDFLMKISTEDYKVIFCTLLAYPLTTKTEEIDMVLHTYNDYVNSQCEMVVVVIDNQFVDILSKDEKVIQQVYKNALANNFKHIKILEKVDDDTLLTNIH